MQVSSLNQRFLSLNIFFRLFISAIFIAITIIATQDIQIFPYAFYSLFQDKSRKTRTLPEGVGSKFIETSDQESLEVWRLPIENSKYFAIIFHGNGSDVQNFFPYQKFFQSQGITSYGFDYRGYGKSSGWPSERGLYLDADAIIRYVLEKESTTVDRLIIAGISIGSGPASYIATQHQIDTLLLFAPFISLPEAIKSSPPFSLFHYFSFYDFPVKENASKLEDTCLIIAHGKADRIIPQKHGLEIFESYKNKKYFVNSNLASHNDILFKAAPQVAKALSSCLE